ncbi:LmeA family phospholipid-binding protein [Corynebacterium lubricantis]|uniref:LmeA family phospholipid-binding protein n=1 Tax=Corynebacterium lubricantis TaxID=541095 RepID=UPI0003785B06|nr:LmeA family phospholipid-binding protein [Corynebacterium lubricantis]
MSRSTPSTGKKAGKTTGKSTVWKVLISIAVVILVLFLVAEVGMRWYMSKQFRDGFEEGIPANVTVEGEPQLSFGPTPLTFSLFTGTIPSMTLDTPSTLEIGDDFINGSPAAQVELKDLSIRGDNNVGHLQVTSEIPDDFLETAMQMQLQEAISGGNAGDYSEIINVLGISDIAANPTSGTFDLAITQGIFEIELLPVMVDGQLQFEVESSRLFGFDLPPETTDALKQLSESGIQEELVGPLQIQQFTVIQDGFRVTLTGDNVNLDELSSTSAPAPKQP